MITKCIVSVFTRVCKTAVLFDSSLRNRLTKSLVLVGGLLAPTVANADLIYKNWWGAENVKVSQLNDCGSVYSISYTAQNEGQLQLDKDGVNVSSKNTVFASDMTDFTWQTGGSSAVKFTGSTTTNLVIYLVSGSEKDTLTSVLPTYGSLMVKGEGYKNMSLTSTPTFTAMYCEGSSSSYPSNATFQWQKYDSETSSWVNIDDATESEYTAPAKSLLDETKVRVVMTSNGKSMTSGSLTVTYAMPSVVVKLEGAESFETVQKPHYENELDFGKPASVEFIPVGGAEFDTYELYSRSDNDKKFTKLVATISGDNPVYNFKPEENLEYLVVATGNDVRPGHDSKPVSVKDTFFVRVRYSWDEGAELDTLFFDDFGRFTKSNQYTTFDGKEFTDFLTDQEGESDTIVNYWAPDYFNSVKNHKYATNDPMVGPLDEGEECGSTGYLSHYACWTDKGHCDGYRVEDGYYAILPNPDYSNCGQNVKDYWNGYDHTTEESGVLGGMLFVNCADGSRNKVLIEREIQIDNDCDNARLLFSAYVNNATAIASNTPVNVRLLVISGTDTIASVPSGNIYPRSMKGGMWANLSFMFSATKGGKYTLQLVNNQEGGKSAGNDLLFDDILILAAYPTVNVYRDREKNSMQPIDTCEAGEYPLYLLNQHDIKKYINNPKYLYQYSKDSINWTNIGAITNIDSFVVVLDRENPLSWDTTYYRGIVGSNSEVIDAILEGNPPALSCDNVYAISEPFRVIYDFGGPLDEDAEASLCVGDTFSIKVHSHKRPVYRWVDSKTNEVINNMDTTFTYVVSAEDPADSVFYFVAESRLGCTDTMKVTVHRKLFVDFKTPDPFITCATDNTPAQLTDIFPAEGAKFDWKSGEFVETEGSDKLVIPSSLPQQGTFEVTGSAEGYCTTTKSFKYDIHNKINAVLIADDRDDSLFCNGANVKLKLTANVSVGTPVTYYWLNDGQQVAFTKHPENTYSFGGLTEGNHVFSVKIVDEVCNKTDNSTEFETTLPIAVREPISIMLTADTAVCEGAAFAAEVKCEHLLDADATEVKWTVTTDNGILANAKTITAASETSNSITPDPKTTTIEKLTLKVAIDDKVCPNNANASVSTDVNIYKKLDVTVTTDRTDDLFCMKNDAGITFTAVTNRGYVKRYDWIADGVLDKSTYAGDNTHTFAVETEGTHVYGVTMTDGVCNLPGESEFKFSVPVKTRKPIELALTSDTAVCVTGKINASVECQHLLDATGSVVTWVVETANGQLATAQTTTEDQKTSNSVLPRSTTNTTEALMLTASTTDEVCLNDDNTTRVVLDTKKTNIYKELDVTVAYNRTDNLFCMEGNSEIEFTATTNKGVVNKYEWTADGSVVATTGANENSYKFLVLTEGTHVYGVKMYDGVCSVDGNPYPFSQSVETRKPVTIQLNPASVAFCEDGSVNIEAKLEHLLADPSSVAWAVSANGQLASATSATAEGIATNTLTANVANLTTSKENVTVSAKVHDDVCLRDVNADDVTIDMHKLVDITLTVDGVNGSKCLVNPGDEVVNLTVNINRGDPAYYIWSNNDRTEEPNTQYTLTLGSNFITVLAFDLVCKKDGAAATALTSVETRNPLNISVAQTKGVTPTCVGEEVEMSTTVTNNFEGDLVIYSWSPVASDQPVITDKPGVGVTNYVATVIASNGICPAQSNSSSVTVQDSVYISIDAPETLCQEQDSSVALPLTVTVISGNPQSFVWSTGEETVNGNLDVYPTRSQQFWVYAKDQICANSFKVYTKPVDVSNNFTLLSSAKYYEVQMGTDVQLNAKIKESGVYSAPENVTWYRDEKARGTVPMGDFNMNMPKQGTYVFYAVADGGHCGMITSEPFEVEVGDYHQVPNAFTPYNDNPKNNIFMKGYYVEIFNRYQQLVFEGDNGWDGKYNGSLADPGTYFYRLRKKDGRMLKGTIELVKF